MNKLKPCEHAIAENKQNVGTRIRVKSCNHDGNTVELTGKILYPIEADYSEWTCSYKAGPTNNMVIEELRSRYLYYMQVPGLYTDSGPIDRHELKKEVEVVINPNAASQGFVSVGCRVKYMTEENDFYPRSLKWAYEQMVRPPLKQGYIRGPNGFYVMGDIYGRTNIKDQHPNCYSQSSKYEITDDVLMQAGQGMKDCFMDERHSSLISDATYTLLTSTGHTRLGLRPRMIISGHKSWVYGIESITSNNVNADSAGAYVISPLNSNNYRCLDIVVSENDTVIKLCLDGHTLFPWVKSLTKMLANYDIIDAPIFEKNSIRCPNRPNHIRYLHVIAKPDCFLDTVLKPAIGADECDPRANGFIALETSPADGFTGTIRFVSDFRTKRCVTTTSICGYQQQNTTGLGPRKKIVILPPHAGLDYDNISLVPHHVGPILPPPDSCKYRRTRLKAPHRTTQHVFDYVYLELDKYCANSISCVFVNPGVRLRSTTEGKHICGQRLSPCTPRTNHTKSNILTHALVPVSYFKNVREEYANIRCGMLGWDSKPIAVDSALRSRLACDGSKFNKNFLEPTEPHIGKDGQGVMLGVIAENTLEKLDLTCKPIPPNCQKYIKDATELRVTYRDPIATNIVSMQKTRDEKVRMSLEHFARFGVEVTCNRSKKPEVSVSVTSTTILRRAFISSCDLSDYEIFSSHDKCYVTLKNSACAAPIEILTWVNGDLTHHRQYQTNTNTSIRSYLGGYVYSATYAKHDTLAVRNCSFVTSVKGQRFNTGAHGFYHGRCDYTHPPSVILYTTTGYRATRITCLRGGFTDGCPDSKQITSVRFHLHLYKTDPSMANNTLVRTLTFRTSVPTTKPVESVSFLHSSDNPHVAAYMELPLSYVILLLRKEGIDAIATSCDTEREGVVQVGAANILSIPISMAADTLSVRKIPRVARPPKEPDLISPVIDLGLLNTAIIKIVFPISCMVTISIVVFGIIIIRNLHTIRQELYHDRL
uniref:Uncharacterized protein n=1 Tax=Branchiostoma floridae TaxID=7739 RepID=C3ZJP0_BRAFL|eukprot:XP_002591164.1 hypothetical protein BRAFLDRAFT_105366 [Branchiostoma floridae]